MSDSSSHEEEIVDDSADNTGASPTPKAKKKGVLASRRGIDTMFRTAYREQLELTALADSKANIMIQLNAIIVSIMLASSGVIMDAHPWLQLPTGALTLTALVSIVFAVLSARPNLNKPKEMSVDDIQSGRANILFFGNFARISEDAFIEGMWAMFEDTEHVYRNMTRHVHGMGTVLLRKFRLLRVAYTVFLAGLFVSGALFLLSLYGAESGADQRNTSGKLDGIYEPSGVVQLRDGRVLLVEDEAERAISVLELAPDGGAKVVATDLGATLADLAPGLGGLDDLEGATIDPSSGDVYVVTSFSSQGRSRPPREKLARLSFDGATLVSAQFRLDLKPRLLARLADIGIPNAARTLNVEGLAFDPRARRLLLGLRAPLKNGHALVIPIDVQSLFDDAPAIGEIMELDLRGGGIRGMAYVEEIGGVVVIARAEGKRARPFELWRWDPLKAPSRIHLAGVDLRQAEGVAPVVVQGHKRLLIVSDEGKAKTGRASRYLLLRYDQLSAET